MLRHAVAQRPGLDGRTGQAGQDGHGPPEHGARSGADPAKTKEKHADTLQGLEWLRILRSPHEAPTARTYQAVTIQPSSGSSPGGRP